MFGGTPVPSVKLKFIAELEFRPTAMLKLLSAQQIRDWDKFTIENEPISSYDLMERASLAFTYWFAQLYETERTVYIFCGTGNNGGDGLAIARLLHERFFNVKVIICGISNTVTDDFKKNLNALPHRADILKGEIEENDAFPEIPQDAIIIDALLGTGLTRPVLGYWAAFFKHLNDTENEIVSVDIPSGLFMDKSMLSPYGCIQADRVFSFEIPKIAFLLPENHRYIGDFTFKSIGLKQEYLNGIQTENIFLTKEYIYSLLKKRSKFDHKGTFGHALLVVGSFGMAGAGVLAAKACLRSGVGLLTVHTPQCNRIIMQTSVPEAMVRVDADEYVVSQNTEIDAYKTIGIGCGIGKAGRTASALKNYLMNFRKPMVIDADALNIIASNPEMLDLIPKNSILTPHFKEFERLFGHVDSDFERLKLLKQKSKELKINILLKGAHSVVADTEGVCYFNSTGNAGMATGGSGDVLTGILTGLLARGYEPSQAAIVGMFLHGEAGDKAAEKLGEEALIASDIIEYLFRAM